MRSRSICASDRARKLEQDWIRIVSDDFERESLDLGGQYGIAENRNAQTVAKRAARGTRLAFLRPRARARPSIGTVRLGLPSAGHAASSVG
jgi:hypothetical protein